VNAKHPLAQRALLVSTLAFAANFSVWTLYAVLALELERTLELSATELGLLLAAPMLTGALSRVPAGLWAERVAPKTLFSLQMLVVTPALFVLPQVQQLWAYLVLGLWIGLSGASFTFGIRYVTDWFPRGEQGTAMGIFGVGNAGAAITLVIAPFIVDQLGWQAIGWIYGLGLLAVAIVFHWVAPQTPDHLLGRQPQQLKAQLEPLKRLQVWRFGLYYYFVFGSFLALIMWLPQYYRNAYSLSLSQAMSFTLLFVATSSMVRALGGWFADRYGGRAVNWSVFWVCLVCLFFLSYPPTTMTIHGIERDVDLTIEINLWLFTALILIIGLAQGFGRASVYKVIHDYYPHQMGSVGGMVAAIGALGGCTLPVIFGVAVDLVGIYSVCFMILYGVSAVCMIAMFFANKADRYRRRVREALEHNFLDE